MGLGTSILLIAVGAILDFGVTVTERGFNLHSIGLILIVVGAIGLLVSLMFWSTWGGFGGYHRRTYIENSLPQHRRRTYEDEIV